MMKTHRYALKSLTFGLCLSGLILPASAATEIPANPYGKWGFNPAEMDRNVDPGDDFFNYALGGWVKTTKIPDDRASWGVIAEMSDRTLNQLKTMVEIFPRQTRATSESAKMAILYDDMMDQAKRDALDISVLKTRLSAIDRLASKSQLARYYGQTLARFGASPFPLYISGDAKKPGFDALYMAQGGLGLPNRDYYLEDSFKDKREHYQTYIAQILTLAGRPNPEASAKAIFEFETKIAKASWTDIESRDDVRMYDDKPLSALKAYAPGFDWIAYFKAAGVSQARKIVVGNNTAIQKIAKILVETPLETQKAWAAFHLINQTAPYMSQRFVEARFDFFSRDLTGAKALRPLWKRALGVVEANMGMPLGHAYVKRYFTPQAKAMMSDMVSELKAAMKARLETLTWMGPATRAKAQEKLAAMRAKVAYPDHWQSYAALSIRKGDLIGNIERATAFEWTYNLRHIDRPSDPDQWGMTPQTVNAQYDPTRNELTLPAANLQAPNFDANADLAVNYGGIGATIGHEMIHGFDDEGRLYDKNGKLDNWWTPEDEARFKLQADRLGAQFDQYEVLPGVHVQGALSMGENIADLGGTLVALDAYHLALKHTGKAAPILDGFSGDQRYFLGYALSWRNIRREDAIRMLVRSNPHAPENFRVIGPVRNMDEWYSAFSIKSGTKYYLKPEDRVRLW